MNKIFTRLQVSLGYCNNCVGLPPASWCKTKYGWSLSTVGCVVAARGVIRDENRHWMEGFAKPLGICSTNGAEFGQVFEGLKRA